MADPRQSYFEGRNRLAEETRLRQEKERREREEAVERHAHRMVRAGEVMNVFQNYRDIFSQHSISYGVDDMGVGYNVLLILSRNRKTEHLRITVPAVKGAPFKLQKTTKIVEERVDETYYTYDIEDIDLPSDTVEMTGDILKRLGKGELAFTSPWKGRDDGIVRNTHYYFSPGGATRNIIIVIIFSLVVVAILFLVIKNTGWLHGL